MQTKITIITTAYNHSKYIGETIESIINQTFLDWELLVGDDNSPDNTYEIALEYAKNNDRIKVWKHKENLGIVGNMNFLINKASEESEYIAFLEGDDLFAVDNLEKKLEIFNKYKEVVLVYNNLDFIDGNSKVFYKNHFKTVDYIIINRKLSIVDFILGNFYCSYSSLMIDKKVLIKTKIKSLSNDKMYLTSDWDLFGNIANNYKIYGLKETLTLYRKHNGNCSGNSIALISDLILGIEDKILKYGIVKNRDIKYKLFYINMYLLYLSKQRFKTLKYGLLSFKYSFKKNIVERLGMMLFILFPDKINNYCYNKFKK